jgi:hypothetical protein
MISANEIGAEPGSCRAEAKLTKITNHTPGAPSSPPVPLSAQVDLYRAMLDVLQLITEPVRRNKRAR